MNGIDFERGTVTTRHLKTRARLLCAKFKARLGRRHQFCPECGEEISETEKLPAPEILEFTTMCGHGIISRYLVEDIIERVKAGKMSAKNGAIEIGKQCCCGIYNPDRGEKLLQALATKK